MASVDVVVPCYNYARYLRDCVGSITSQEGVDARVLIIDDCSPDNSAEVATELAGRDPRVEFRRHSVNRGHIATYNEGLLEWARADYSLLLSADDMLAPGALKRAAEVFGCNPQVGMVCGRELRFENVPPNVTKVAASYSAAIIPGPEYLALSCASGKNLVSTPTAVVRTSLQKAIGGYRRELPHTGDMEVWMRVAARSDIARLDVVQAFYRVHGMNMHFRETATILRELEHHWAAFASVFEHDRGLLANPEQLRSAAGSSIAMMALQAAYNLGNGQTELVQKLVRFATRICPSVKRKKIYWSIVLRLGMGDATWGALRRVTGRSVAPQRRVESIC